jgi:hypothetical protein
VTQTRAGNRPHRDLVLWPHTGVLAPSLLQARGIQQGLTSRGVAYTAELIHPELGPLGSIVNNGDGGATRFDPADKNRFGHRDLERFAEQCRQDGEPLSVGESGTRLLEATLDEAEYTSRVDKMRATGGFLIRYYDPSGPGHDGWGRGPAILFPRPALFPGRRHQLAKRAAQLPHVVPENAVWQMFNGCDWAPLLPTPSDGTARSGAANTARAAEVAALRAECTDSGQSRGPMSDGFHLMPPRASYDQLTDDDIPRLRLDQWCRCRAGAPATVRWQLWNTNCGVLASGTAHRARRCRRLVRIN